MKSICCMRRVGCWSATPGKIRSGSASFSSIFPWSTRACLSRRGAPDVGDLAKLNSELRTYSGQARFNVIQLPFRAVDVGEVKVRSLGAAEQALFRHEIEIGQGVAVREFTDFAGGYGVLPQPSPKIRLHCACWSRWNALRATYRPPRLRSASC
jgi:hypothetical protein